MRKSTDITSSARAYGYGLLGSARIDVPRPIEDVVLNLMYEDGGPRLAEGLPVMCFRGKPDYSSVAERALVNGIQNQIGFLLAGVRYVFQNQKVSYDSALDAAIEKLYAAKTETVGIITKIEELPNWMDILRKMQTEEEKKWNVLGGPRYPDMEKKFVRFTT